MAMSANEVAYQKAHIHDSKRVNIVASISALTALATAAIFLRAYVRWTTRLRFQADDYTIFAAAVRFNQSLFRLDRDRETVRSLALICYHLHRYGSPSSFSRKHCG